MLLFWHLFIWFCCDVHTLTCVIWSLFPWARMEPGSPVLGAQGLRPWTTSEVPDSSIIISSIQLLSQVRLLATLWTAAYRAPPPWDFPGTRTVVGCHSPRGGIIYLSISVWLTSLSVTVLKSMLLQMALSQSCLWPSSIPPCTCNTSSLDIHRSVDRLFPRPGYCEQRCHGHGVPVSFWFILLSGYMSRSGLLNHMLAGFLKEPPCCAP